MRHRRRPRELSVALGALVLLTVVATSGMVAGVPQAAAEETGTGASGPYDRVVDVTFPVGGEHRFTDDYHAARGGSSAECRAQGVEGRRHQATDIMAAKMQPVYAAQAGVVTWAPETEPSYGWMITIRGVDGLEYSYVHLNNDTPGTDDGKGGIDRAYAPGVRKGVHVERGQHIGWVGDSGNAESTAPHLHLEMEDPELHDERLVCPYQSKRLNPYPSLMAALERGDLPKPSPGGSENSYPGAMSSPFDDVPPDGTHARSIEELVEAGVTRGCSGERRFCPLQNVRRGQMATFVGKASGMTPAEPGSPTGADDVAPDAVHAEWIGALLSGEVATLCGERLFCPLDDLTRRDMAVWLANALGISGGESSFADVPTDAPYAPAVAALADRGFTKGCEPDLFCPDAPVTRAQMATFLVAAFLGG